MKRYERPIHATMGRLALVACHWVVGGLLSALVVPIDRADAADPPVETSPEQPSAADLEFFEKRVRPLLVERCFGCHSAKSESPKGGLRLDTREAILRGGDLGPAATAGDPNRSLLIEAVGYQSQTLQMPPKGKLPDAEIAVLTQWVQRGLAFPNAAPQATRRAGIDWQAARRHWAFQPLQPRNGSQLFAGVPQRERLETRIDPWIAAARAQHNLKAGAEADRRTLLRRLKFDLLGLPPDVEELVDFLADDSPDAYQRLVDRFLAHPALGERWGRMWLDLARYCDVPEQWREGEAQAYWYRDWVVQSLNHDRPYADFVRRQLAADLLPDSTPADSAALGLLGLSPTYWKELKLDHLVIQQVVAEEWEERVEALGGALLGLTLACARCHDHKFEPVTVEDYYALAGVLASIKQEDRPVIDPAIAQRARDARAKVKQLQQEVDKLLAQKPPTDEGKQKAEQLQSEIRQLKEATPAFNTMPAFGVSEASLLVLPDGPQRTKLEYRDGQPQDVAIQIRGNPARQGPVVPRRFLTVLSGTPPAPFRQGSGRRELADAIVGDGGPLAARVIVNRYWLQHFGRGLVTTPSNLGTQAEPPSHPDLLDDLAAAFVAHDWSLKWLHRELVSSATYRQSSHREREQDAIDPENIWLSRMSVRRLDVEAWRDAMLVASGELVSSIGGPARELTEPANYRRTIYGTVKRRELTDLLRLYDFPDPVTHAASRQPTTTPLQQLFVLNSPFFQARTGALADRVLRQNLPDDPARIHWVYRELFGRTPTPDELELGVGFVAAPTMSEAEKRGAWQRYAQVLLGGNEFCFVD